MIITPPSRQQLQWQHAASEPPQGSTQIMVNGQSFSGTGYQLDGTENRDPILGIIVINPNLEAIGETKITSQNYDAEFGQAIAGVASVSTRSGSNDLHGAAFLFRQNDVFQTRNPFSQATKDPLTGKFVPDTIKNQFGGALGGRMIKDKLFVFGDYEGLRSKNGVSDDGHEYYDICDVVFNSVSCAPNRNAPDLCSLSSHRRFWFHFNAFH